LIDVRTLTEGGQTADVTADALVAFLDAAKSTLDLALYDVRLPGAVGDRVAGALRAAHDRGVRVRLAYNLEDVRRAVPIPPPPQTRPELLAELPIELKACAGVPDLMHHKYVVRDAAAVWTGSTNWTLDSWTREENVLATVDSAGLAAAFAANFDELWREAHVESTGSQGSDAVDVAGTPVRPWFCPGHGRALSHRIADALGTARRVRIASPVLTSGPIIGTLAERLAEPQLDLGIVCDATQLRQVFGQWRANPASAWKAPLLERIVRDPRVSGKRSTPYAPGTVHDFMHAKVTVADDRVFLGSFNLSRSGELNAENVLEIPDAALADRLAGWIDGVRARYPDPVPTS
jgi:phosphatidylserine/phosphatidylglycerophosphate/cardiolipin synthase-like enzyme